MTITDGIRKLSLKIDSQGDFTYLGHYRHTAAMRARARVATGEPGIPEMGLVGGYYARILLRVPVSRVTGLHAKVNPMPSRGCVRLLRGS